MELEKGLYKPESNLNNVKLVCYYFLRSDFILQKKHT